MRVSSAPYTVVLSSVYGSLVMFCSGKFSERINLRVLGVSNRVRRSMFLSCQAFVSKGVAFLSVSVVI